MIASWSETIELATKQKGMFSVYISNDLYHKEGDDVIWDAVLSGLAKLYIKDSNEYNNIRSAVIIGGLFFFDTEDEAWMFYNIFNVQPVYSSAIYASLCSPVDGCMTENT